MQPTTPRNPKLVDSFKDKRAEEGADDYANDFKGAEYSDGYIHVEIWKRGLFQAPIRIERSHDPHCSERRMIADELLLSFSLNQWERQTRKDLKKIGLKPKEVLELGDKIVVVVRWPKLMAVLFWWRKELRLTSWLKYALRQARSYSANVEVEPNLLFGASGYDPLYKEQWYYEILKVKQAHDCIEMCGQMVGENPRDEKYVTKVGIIDSGIDHHHEDLVSVDGTLSRSFICCRGLLCKVYCCLFGRSPKGYMDERHSHGTGCAAAIGAGLENDKGVSPVAFNAQVVALKFMGEDAMGTAKDAARAIHYALDQNIRILLLGWGGSCGSIVLKDALERAERENAVVVVAAGNRGEKLASGGPYFYPASYQLKNMIVVGGMAQRKIVDKGGAATYEEYPVSGSNCGDQVHIGAPGLQCKTTRRSHRGRKENLQGRYGYFSGTSAAASYVAATCELVRLKLMLLGCNDPRYQDIIQAILDGAAHISGLCFQCGRRLDAYGAVMAAKNRSSDDVDYSCPPSPSTSPDPPAPAAPRPGPPEPQESR